MSTLFWIVIGGAVWILLVVGVLRFLHLAAKQDEKMRRMMEDEHIKRHGKEEGNDEAIQS